MSGVSFQINTKDIYESKRAATQFREEVGKLQRATTQIA